MKQVMFLILFTYPSLFSYAQEPCIPAADYIFEKYKNYNIIAIAEGPHGTINTHKFFGDLLQNEKINKTIDYVIVEFANVAFQETLDMFIRGEEVPFEEVQMIWRSATQSHSPIFESPLYFNLLETIRKVNFTLPENKKIHVIAGDPFIDWSKIHSQKEFFSSLSQRDVFPSELAIKYGIDSAKKVLLIYGNAHLSKSSDEVKDSTYWTIPFYINKKYPNSILTIDMFVSKNYNDELKFISLPENTICDLSKSPLGLLKFINDYNPDDSLLKLKDAFDAECYIGPSDNWQTGKPALIDSVYWSELNRRSLIVWGEGIDKDLLKGH